MLEHQPTMLFLNCWTMNIHFIIMIIVKTIISESKIPEYSIRIQDFQKKTCSLNTTVQELKSKKFSLKKIKDDLMLYVSILVLKIMMH